MIKTLVLTLTTPFLLTPVTYSRPAMIMESDQTHILYETEDGNLWQMSGDYSWETEGRKVTLTFGDNGTEEDIYDDVIMGVQ